jgi:hypothetical protein
MAVPSRAFVGILVFGLIATLAIVPYTILLLSGYHPPPQTPYEALFPQDDESAGGTKLVLVIASLFSLALVVSAWRGLLHGARLDREMRQAKAAAQSAPSSSATSDEQPPGYQ